MKKILYISCWIVLLIQSYHLQAQNKKHLKPYAIVGSQYYEPDFISNTEFNPKENSFSTEIGISMNFEQISTGTEFYNSKSNNSIDQQMKFNENVNSVFSQLNTGGRINLPSYKKAKTQVMTDKKTLLNKHNMKELLLIENNNTYLSTTVY